MQDLIKQEQFELEILEALNSKKLLSGLVFTGGTMLRLCWGLNRFSVDLDFWVTKPNSRKKLFEDIQKLLARDYVIRDAAEKFHTLIFEIRSPEYPRNLKIEIRTQPKKVKTETAIAYSVYSASQVFVKCVSLADMMRAKIAALLDRREIRDAFDMEFLLKRGITVDAPAPTLKKILAVIQGFKPTDYSAKLGSLIAPQERKYYTTQHFKILASQISKQLAP